MKTKGMILVFLFFLYPSIVLGASQEAIQSLKAKLEAWEISGAWMEVRGLLTDEPKDPSLLELGSHIAFHKGDYQEALKLIKLAIEQGGDEEQKKAFALFIEETIAVVTPFKRYESPHFIISLDEKQDGILVDYLTDALEKTHQAMAKQYGFNPREKIRVEVFPDTKAFYLATTLSARDIEVTGAVGIAQFNKLMTLSPRALVYGYRWLDAISHEFMHYLIIKLTSNKAPIWFHEGLAKYEETRWKQGPSYLSSTYQTLLARAQTEGKLIPFEKMEPSLVKLETTEEVQLAYAQAASAIEFIIDKVGYEGLQEVMKRMNSSKQKGAGDSIVEVLGLKFSEFEEKWKAFLSSKGLKEVSGVTLRRYKVKEGKLDEERMDMGEIKSLVAKNKTHLGDLLKERGRMEAAVLEYRRALNEAGNSVPIMNKLSSALMTMGRNEEALEILKRAKALSPDHPSLHTALGQVYLKLNDFQQAKESFRTSLEINPFNPEVHLGLATAYERLGDWNSSQKARGVAKKLIP